MSRRTRRCAWVWKAWSWRDWTCRPRVGVPGAPTRSLHLRMIHLTASDVDRLFPVDAAIAAARTTALTVARGQVHQAARIWHQPPGMPGQFGVMPSYLPDDGDDPAIFVTKLVGVFPGATPSVNGVLVVADGTTGAPLATIDAAAVTARRTAGASAVSIDLLSRSRRHEHRHHRCGGAGFRAHLEAACAVRPPRPGPALEPIRRTSSLPGTARPHHARRQRRRPSAICRLLPPLVRTSSASAPTVPMPSCSHRT